MSVTFMRPTYMNELSEQISAAEKEVHDDDLGGTRDTASNSTVRNRPRQSGQSQSAKSLQSATGLQSATSSIDGDSDVARDVDNIANEVG